MNTNSLVGIAALSIMAAASVAVAAPPPKAAPKTGDYKGKPHTAIPDTSYGVYSFDEASKEAAKKKRPLAFIVTDERADDKAVKDAGAKVFWALEDDTIPVVLKASTANAWERLPDPVVKGIKSADLGKEYPKLFVMNDDVSTPLAGMTGAKVISTDEKPFNKIGKELKKLNGTKTASTDYPPPSLEAPKPAAAPAPAATPAPAAMPAPAPAAPAAPEPAPTGAGLGGSVQETWTNAAGQAIQATLLEVRGNQVMLLMANGNKVPYEISKLSPASQARVKELSEKK